MQSRPPSVADQTSFCSKHSDKDGDDLEEKEFVTVIKIGSETTQSEVPGLSGIIVIKTERSTSSYPLLCSHVLELYTSFHSAPCSLLSLPYLIIILFLLSPAPVFLACPPSAPLLPHSPMLSCSPFLSCPHLPSCPFDVFIFLLFI